MHSYLGILHRDGRFPAVRGAMVNTACFEKNKRGGRYATSRRFECSVAAKVIPIKATEMQEVSAYVKLIRR